MQSQPPETRFRIFRNRNYVGRGTDGALRRELPRSVEQPVDLLWCVDVRHTAISCRSAERIGGRCLITFILGLHGSGKASNDEQSASSLSR